MIYINDSKQKYQTYDDVVAFAVKNGVDPKRAYIYLAALGVKGANGRVMAGLDYSSAVKLAVKDNKLVETVRACKSCKGLVFNG